MKSKQKVPVSERALIQRINRKLVKDGELVKKCREGRWDRELGDYYKIDFENSNVIVEKYVDLEETGRKLGVLAEYEKLEA